MVLLDDVAISHDHQANEIDSHSKKKKKKKKKLSDKPTCKQVSNTAFFVGRVVRHAQPRLASQIFGARPAAYGTGRDPLPARRG